MLGIVIIDLLYQLTVQRNRRKPRHRYMGKETYRCKKCDRNRVKFYDSLCKECSHCDACNSYTASKKNGLCGDCRGVIVKKSREIFFAALDGVTINQQVRNGIIFTIYFTKDIDRKIKTLERIDISEKYENKGLMQFFKKSKNPLSESFQILSTMLKISNVRSNTVKMEVNLTFKQRFGAMISGGNFDYRQGIDEGYIIHVVAESDDGCTIPIITKALREIRFGCLVGNLTIDGFLESENPTMEGEERVTQEVAKSVLDMFNPRQ